MKLIATIASSRMQHHLQSMCMVIWLVGLSLVQPIAALAQTNTSMPLPPEAQEAVDKGIIAAKVPDYPLAIRYFEQARKLAPNAPVIYLNLGLAESKIPGRELRAMAWFGAYLTAYPDAPNAAAVKDQIVMLEVRNQSNVLRLIKSVEDVANQILGMSVDDIWNGLGDKNSNLTAVAILYVQAGDTKAALKIADLQGGFYYTAIAAAQAKSGDFAGAKKSFALSKNSADLIKDAGDKSYNLSNIAQHQIEAGDLEGAQHTLASAKMSADLVTDASQFSLVRSTLAIAQAKSGDIVGAQKTAELIQDANDKHWALEAITEAQARTNSPKEDDPSISAAVTESQPVITVSNWLNKLDDENITNDCALNTGPFLDLGGYLNSSLSNDPPIIFRSYYDTAVKIVAAHNIITEMLKQGAGK